MVEKGSNGPTLPNDDDCDRPACGDTVSMLKSVMKRAKQSKGNTPVSKSGQAANNAGTYDNKNTLGCPPGKEELGSSTWTLLHTMSAWYPDKPSHEDTLVMKHMIEGVGRFYPCTWCANDFRENLKTSPVR
jgi:FAD-linked sulfhydryl oxidase